VGRPRAAWLFLLVVLWAAIPLAVARAEAGVEEVMEDRFTVATPIGQGEIPVALSMDWSRSLLAVSRVIIVVHGPSRAAERYLAAIDAARRAAGTLARTTLIIAPQFLTPADIAEHALPDEVARWDRAGWSRGAPALAPAALSSFDVLDALLERLAERPRFPALTHVVVVGHAAGAEMVQRHAAVGWGPAALAARGIALRHVVANPSSWLWFGEDRPDPPPPGSCPDVDAWHHGLKNPPPYVGDVGGVEARYMARDLVYLIGDADIDPDHRDLDRSCAAMAQGETRFARAMQFMFHLELRHPARVYHRIVLARGVGHDADRVFASPCGLAAVFERAGCAGLR
jgi:hypothetical protein